MRHWAGPGMGIADITVVPNRFQVLVGGADNTVRNVNIGAEFNLEGRPRLGAEVPRWYGETVGFWDEDSLITWTANVQGWFTHGSFEHSDQLELVEIYTPRYDGDEYLGLEHEAIFYDPEAFLQPLRQTRFLAKRFELNEWGEAAQTLPYHYIRCNQTIFNVDGHGVPLTPGTKFEYTVEDLYGRPWAAVWERYFEDGMSRPEGESLFGF